MAPSMAHPLPACPSFDAAGGSRGANGPTPRARRPSRRQGACHPRLPSGGPDRRSPQHSARTHATTLRASGQIGPDRRSDAGTPAGKRGGNGTSGAPPWKLSGRPWKRVNSGCEPISSCNFARRLKTLNGLTPHKCICQIWTCAPERSNPDPINQMPGPNTQKAASAKTGRRQPFPSGAANRCWDQTRSASSKLRAALWSRQSVVRQAGLRSAHALRLLNRNHGFNPKSPVRNKPGPAQKIKKLENILLSC